MKKFTRKEMTNMLVSVAAVAAIPLCVWLMRPRLLSAQSATELPGLARTYREEEILKQMHKRYGRISLNFDSPDTAPDLNARWQEIQHALEEAGAEPEEARKVVQSAQIQLKENWPCLAEQGSLHGQTVWIIAASSPYDTGFIGWLCLPSAEDIRRQEVEKYCTAVKVAAVSTQPPYQVLN